MSCVLYNRNGEHECLIFLLDFHSQGSLHIPTMIRRLGQGLVENRKWLFVVIERRVGCWNDGKGPTMGERRVLQTGGVARPKRDNHLLGRFSQPFHLHPRQYHVRNACKSHSSYSMSHCFKLIITVIPGRVFHHITVYPTLSFEPKSIRIY